MGNLFIRVILIIFMVPTISVILCTYNGGNILKKCLKSILAQKYKDFEIICVDGGSSDNTLKLINKFMKKDKRIKLVINNE